MDHICVTYMIIYVCRHMIHIYDPALKSYVVSPCDGTPPDKLLIFKLLLSTGCSKQSHVVVKTAAELLSVSVTR